MLINFFMVGDPGLTVLCIQPSNWISALHLWHLWMILLDFLKLRAHAGQAGHKATGVTISTLPRYSIIKTRPCRNTSAAASRPDQVPPKPAQQICLSLFIQCPSNSLAVRWCSPPNAPPKVFQKIPKAQPSRIPVWHTLVPTWCSHFLPAFWRILMDSVWTYMQIITSLMVCVQTKFRSHKLELW